MSKDFDPERDDQKNKDSGSNGDRAESAGGSASEKSGAGRIDPKDSDYNDLFNEENIEIDLGPANHRGMHSRGPADDNPFTTENLYKLLGLDVNGNTTGHNERSKSTASSSNSGFPFGGRGNIFDVLTGAGANVKSGSGKNSGGRGNNFAGRGGGSNNSGSSGAATGGEGKRLFRPFRVFILVAMLLSVIVAFSAQVWTEVLWYQQTGYQRVLFTHWLAYAGMFVLSYLVCFLVMSLNLKWVFHKRPDTVGLPSSIRLYHNLVSRRAKIFVWVVPALLSIVAGWSMAGFWRQLLLGIYGGSFQEKDPQFHFDISFFVFKLPLVDLTVNFLLLVLLVTLVLVAFGYSLLGAVRLSPRAVASKAARVHLGLLLAVSSLLYALRYFVERYTLVFADGRPTDGAMYTAVNAVLPAKTILAIITVVIAVLFVVAAFRGGWYLPVAGIAVTVISALVIGVGYPMVIQKFRVNPNEREFERPYIERNIKATLKAFGLDKVEHHSYNANTKDTKPGQLRKDADSTQQIRLLDPEIIAPAVRQMKQSRPYYSFPDQFSVDRYTFKTKDGKEEKRDTVIAVRDINQNGLSPSQRNWVNDHTVYTHGFGVVAAYGSQVTSEGLPSYWESSLSEGEAGDIGNYEKRVYFSKYSPDYSIVGAPKGAEKKELDYPDAKKNDSQVYNTFQGSGGPSIGNFWNKLLYSIKFRSTDLFFSDQINPKSQILYDRDPVERVAKVAPYLTLDSRVYPAVVDMDGNPKTQKRLVWIVDGYTTTNFYPYSQHIDLNRAIADTATGSNEQFTTENHVNYMRNSVKAVVDAYDGSVSLYQWDTKDPLLKAWQAIYPGQIKPLTSISGDLMAHMRYPEDIFKVQRSLLTNYHVTNPSQFYTGGDQWKLSEDPTADSRSLQGSSKLQPPYYLTMKMPSQKTAEFSLTSVYIPGGEGKRAAMAGFIAVDSETGNEKGKIRPGYGQIRIISLPSDTTVPGPGQVQNTFNSDPTVNKELNLQDQQGSKVIRGNLLTLPVGGGLLYVQPVYVQSTGTTQFPQLRDVLVGFGDKIGFAPTLKEALDQVFGGDSGGLVSENTGVTDPDQKPTVASEKSAADTNLSNSGTTTNPALKAALQKANQALKDSETARKAGDWAAYGEAQKQLQNAIEQALAAENK